MVGRWVSNISTVSSSTKISSWPNLVVLGEVVVFGICEVINLPENCQVLGNTSQNPQFLCFLQINPLFRSFFLKQNILGLGSPSFFPFGLGMVVPSHLRWTNKTTLPKSRKTFKLIPILRVRPCQPPPMPQISDTLWMEHRGFAHWKMWELGFCVGFLEISRKL